MVNKLKAGRTDLGYCSRFATVLVREKQLFFIISEQIALPIFLLRYVTHGAGSAQGAASRRVPAKHGPQPASMRAAPAFRERLSDFEATNTGSFSQRGEDIKGRSQEL
ncbi:hypothetical protein ACMWBI_07960 [Klebsiella pneumoniae]